MGLSSPQCTGAITGSLTSTFDGNTISALFTGFGITDALTDGTAVNQADMAWWDSERSLVATSENIDLAGSLVDAFGNTLTFARVKGLYIKNRETTAGYTLKIGGAAANAFPLFDNATDIYELGPDGMFLIWEPSAAGLPVTAGTADILKIDAGANTVAYDILIMGASA